MIEPAELAAPRARVRAGIWFGPLALALPLLCDGILGLANGEAPLAIANVSIPARRALFELSLGSALLALALGLRGAFAKPGAARAAAIGLACFALLQANTRLIGSGDTLPAAFVPFVMVRQGSVSFEHSGIHNRTFELDARPLPYWLVARGTRIASAYPIATGALAIVPELPSLLGRLDPSAPEMSDVEKNAAAFLTALGVVLVYLTLRRLVSERAALLAIAVYALATPIATVCGQALFQHTGAVLAFSGAARALFCLERPNWRAAAVGFATGLAVACRPVDVFIALGFAAALISLDRRVRAGVIAAIAGAVPIAVLTLAYQARVFGSPLVTGYGDLALRAWDAVWPEGWVGLLVSPARGMLVIFPVLGLAVWKLVRPGANEPFAAQHRWLALGALLFTAVMAKWRCWDGAVCAGPRMLADTLPILALGLALWMRDMRSRPQRALTAVLASVALLNAVLLMYVPPRAETKRRIWQQVRGPWDPGSYPIAAYLAR